jgi:hypothetical protein
VTLFLTDAELLDLLRLDKTNGPGTVRALDRLGLPKARPPFDHRFTEEVVQWLREFHKIKGPNGHVLVRDGEEHHDQSARKTRRTQVPRPDVATSTKRLGRVLDSTAQHPGQGLPSTCSKVVALRVSADRPSDT